MAARPKLVAALLAAGLDDVDITRASCRGGKARPSQLDEDEAPQGTGEEEGSPEAARRRAQNRDGTTWQEGSAKGEDDRGGAPCLCTAPPGCVFGDAEQLASLRGLAEPHRFELRSRRVRGPLVNDRFAKQADISVESPLRDELPAALVPPGLLERGCP